MATSISLALAAPDREQVVCHLVEARMDDLVVHAEHEDVVKILLHHTFEIRHRFAIDMGDLAAFGRIELAFE